MEPVRIFLPLLGAVVALIVLAKLSVKTADENRTATEVNGRLEFSPDQANFWGIYLFIALLGYGALAGLVGIRSAADLTAPAFCVGFVALLLVAFPGTIATDQTGIEQRYWLRSPKRIAWKDVAKVTVDAKRNEVKITSRQGVKIVHARQLPDQARLLKELHERCTETLVPAVAVETKTFAMSGPAA
jgi:hypothetical protein